MEKNILFCERLKELRGDKSLQSVSNSLGISRATLGYYESGERKPDAEILSRIAKYYKVSSDYLLGLNDSETDNLCNRYKKIREDFEFKPNGKRITAKELSEIFISKGYDTLTDVAIRKIENNFRNVTPNEIKAYCEVFDTTSDYLLGITDEYSSNIEILELYKRLGLSGESITKIESMSKEQQKTVNFLISSSQFTNLINAIYDYRNNHNADEDLKELHIERNDFFKYCCSRILSDILRGL